MDILLLVARLALAVVLIVAAIGKFLDLPGSQRAMRDFGVPELLAGPAGLWLPVVELEIGVLLIPVSTARYAAAGSFVLLTTFVAGSIRNLRRGNRPNCHCFGQFHSEPISPRSIGRTGLLVAVAGFIVIAGWNGPGSSVAGWMDDLSSFERLMVGAGGVLVLMLGAEGWVVLQLLGQNGRLLGRLEALEARVTSLPVVGSSTPVDSSARSLQSQAGGLPVGAVAPSFQLGGVRGEVTTLETLRAPGKPVLLLFTDPHCAPCNALLPEIATWQREFGANTTIAVIGRGSAEQNRHKADTHGLDTILVQAGHEVSDAFEVRGTPSAVLVGADGTIAAPMAGGIEQIRALVSSPAMTGRVAPSFTLPNLDERPVALADLLAPAIPVLLFFTDPRCGPCYELLADIARWQQEFGDRLTVAVVSAGSPEANQAMIADSDIAARTVLLQHGHEVAIAFGAEMAPAAALVGPNGFMVGEVAVGADRIRQVVGKTLGLAVDPSPLPISPTPAVMVGEPAPRFRQPDIDGNVIDLAEARGQTTMVLFWSPGCHHCQELLPNIRAWETGTPGARMIVVSRGPIALNRAAGFQSPLVLDDDRAIARSFGVGGTPAAVVIDPAGRVGSELARGAGAVRALLERGWQLMPEQEVA